MKKAQGLPISTIIIVILVVVVLVAVGLFFFTQFAKGTSPVGDATSEATTGTDQIDDSANWDLISGAKCIAISDEDSAECRKIFDRDECVTNTKCGWRG